MRVSIIQLQIDDKPKQQALAHAMRLIDRAKPADLILLPELWQSGYFNFDRHAAESESLEGPTVAAFRAKAIELKSHIFMGSFVERRAEDLFNTSLLFDPQGQIIAQYRKIHLFGHQSKETEIFSAGRQIATASSALGNAGLATCYDLRFPELFRAMIDKGVEFFLVASAWPAERLDAWRLFNRARAHENLAFLFACNCAGSSAGRPFAGHSMIVGPDGEILAEADKSEQVLSVDLDLGQATRLRSEFPALQDRVFPL